MPCTNGKIETQNQHIARYWRNLPNDAGNNWSTLAPKIAFAHNTSAKYTTGKTSYEIVFGTKPQNPMSLKLGLYRNRHKLCCSKFCENFPSHSHVENSLKNDLLDNLLQPQLSQALLERKKTDADDSITLARIFNSLFIFSTTFYKNSQKSQSFFICYATPMKKAAQ